MKAGGGHELDVFWPREVVQELPLSPETRSASACFGRICTVAQLLQEPTHPGLQWKALNVRKHAGGHG